MKKPTQQEFDTAIMWLQTNDGPNGESEACNHVAAWLDVYLQSLFERSEARRAGCSVRYLRKIVNERPA